MDLMERLYASAEYKKGAYPVMSFHQETTTGIYISDGNQASLVTEDPEMTAELLAAYQEEMEALSLTERTEEIPVTALRFLTEAEKEYLNAISASRTQNFSGSFRLRDMDPRVNFFPVRPRALWAGCGPIPSGATISAGSWMTAGNGAASTTA